MSDAGDVEQFIIEEVGAGLGIESLDHDLNLLASDVLDSLGIMELVSFLEEQYGISVADRDLTPENFQTVDSIVAFVGRKERLGPPMPMQLLYAQAEARPDHTAIDLPRRADRRMRSWSSASSALPPALPGAASALMTPSGWCFATSHGSLPHFTR